MFQFTRFPLPVLCVQTGVTPHDGCRVSPFRHPRIKAWSAAPRGFSQPPTSFFGSRRQGIHRWLFVAWKNKDARARYAILKGLCGNTTRPRLRPGPRRALPQNGTEDDEPVHRSAQEKHIYHRAGGFEERVASASTGSSPSRFEGRVTP